MSTGAISDDVAALRKEVQELRFANTHDGLTSMLNRAGFQAHVDAWILEGTGTLTVLIVDLDDFKMVNDTRGHAVGDEILCTVARQLDAIAYLHHGIAARLSGDEFAVAVRGEDVAVGADVVDDVIACELSVGVAIGLSVDLGHLMWSADVAMYHSKHDAGSAYTVWKEGDKLPAPAHRTDRRRRVRSARHAWNSVKVERHD